jgi:hypothetical protein
MKNISIIQSIFLSRSILLILAGVFVHVYSVAQPSNPNDLSSLENEIKAIKLLLPSQSHAMTDVDYQFSNLWFSGKNANWELADFYVNETRSHLNWTVRLRPIRRLANGSEVDLRPILESVESLGIADLKTSITKRDIHAFEEAYRLTMNQCYGCHVASGKTYLRLHIPDTPSSKMIDFKNTD